MTRHSELAYLVLASVGAILCLAIAAEAQYNSYDSDSNSDSDGGPVLTNAELGKLMRGSGRGHSGAQLRNLHQQQQQQQQQQQLAASRNLYNKQQALQYAPSYNNRRQLSGYNPIGAGRSHESSSDDDADEGSNFGPNFDAGADSGDAGESGNGDTPLNLNQAASGYPGQANDYNGDQAASFGAAFGPSGYGSSSSSVDGNEFGLSSADMFGGEPRRAKSASSLLGSSQAHDEDSGAPQFGPNSAINAGDTDDDARSGYTPDSSSSSNDNDDED